MPPLGPKANLVWYGAGLTEAQIGTDDVSYSIPTTWTPALMGDSAAAVAVSIRITSGGRVQRCLAGNATEDLTAPDMKTGAGLRGRATVPLRPLPTFNRPNVLLLDGGVYRLVAGYDAPTAAYACAPDARISAERMAGVVCEVRTTLAVRRDALGDDVALLTRWGRPLSEGDALWVRCALSSPNEDDEDRRGRWGEGVRITIPLGAQRHERRGAAAADADGAAADAADAADDEAEDAANVHGRTHDLLVPLGAIRAISDADIHVYVRQ